MDDQTIAAALIGAGNLEALLRTHVDPRSGDVPDREAAQLVLRHTIAVKRAVEQWLAARALRAVAVKA